MRDSKLGWHGNEKLGMVTRERKVDSEMENKTEKEITRCKITPAGACGNFAFRELCGIYKKLPPVCILVSHPVEATPHLVPKVPEW